MAEVLHRSASEDQTQYPEEGGSHDRYLCPFGGHRPTVEEDPGVG